MSYLAYGLQPGGPTDKLCPSEDPNEAMAGTGPDGRMVPTIPWRARAPKNRDATGLSSKRILRPSSSWRFRSCSDGTTSTISQLESAQPEREQTPGSENLERTEECVLPSSPMERDTSGAKGGRIGWQRERLQRRP
jgi:hypothetical protein